MSKKWAWMKLILIVLALLAVTLLFLELPRLYYAYSNYQLLRESGTKEYAKAEEKEKGNGFKQVEEYFAYAGERDYNFYDSRVVSEIDYELALKLAAELQLLLSLNCKEIVEEFIHESKNAVGFTDSILYGDKEWEVGIIEFELPKFYLSGTIIYDTNTYKIVWLNCYYWAEAQTELQRVDTDESIVAEYYKELISADIYISRSPGALTVAPYPEDVMLNELLQYTYGYEGEYHGIERIEDIG